MRDLTTDVQDNETSALLAHEDAAASASVFSAEPEGFGYGSVVMGGADGVSSGSGLGVEEQRVKEEQRLRIEEIGREVQK